MRTRIGYRLVRRQIVRRPREEVFAFFSCPENLEAITPDFLHFHILTPQPIVMQSGTRIEYSLRLFGLPLSWRSRILEFEAPARFIDAQERGPYARWIHRHEFRVHREESAAHSGADVPEVTEMIDQVDYALPLGRFASPVHALFVRRALVEIFDYRRDRIREILEGGRRQP